MNEMSALEDLLLSDNYLARCQQLVNLFALLANANQQQQTQPESPTISTPTSTGSQAAVNSVPNSVLQILQHLQGNQDLQQLQQRQREQYRIQQQLQQHQHLLEQQFQSPQPAQQSPSSAEVNDQLQSRLCDPAVSASVHQRHYHNNHHHHQYNNSVLQGGGAAPSSTLLAKLTAATSRPSAQFLSTKLDQPMIEFLEAIYAINDNPEPAAIDMLSKRLNTTSEAVSDWFDETRLRFNPTAGPRSPPAKKRQGGRVVTFSEYQRSLLEAIFDENNYLHPQEYEELSNLIQVPSRNIKIWFKNRRSKQRLSGRVNTPGSLNNSD